MAKREVLGGETGARSEEKPNKAYKQLDHPVRLGGILAPTTNRKSLYNRQYGVFTRDNPALTSFPLRFGFSRSPYVLRQDEITIRGLDRLSFHNWRDVGILLNQLL